MASSGYTAITFVADELLTSTKMNQMAANDASFNSGNGFEDDVIVNRHIGDSAVQNLQIANDTILLGTAATAAAEATYSSTAYVDVPGMTVTFTTTKANQKVAVFTRFQSYKGGGNHIKFLLDGVAGSAVQVNNNEKNLATTGYESVFDFFTVATAGSHTIKLQAQSGLDSPNLLRIIHGEGNGRMLIVSS